MNLEDDTKSSISYEAFVEELDVCDSFTSTLVDILVKVRWPGLPLNFVN